MIILTPRIRYSYYSVTERNNVMLLAPVMVLPDVGCVILLHGHAAPPVNDWKSLFITINTITVTVTIIIFAITITIIITVTLMPIKCHLPSPRLSLREPRLPKVGSRPMPLSNHHNIHFIVKDDQLALEDEMQFFHKITVLF